MEKAAVQSIKLEWKPFRIFLPRLERQFKGLAGLHYVGNSADEGGLSLWFSESPDEETKNRILGLWESLNEAEERECFLRVEKLGEVVARAKEQLFYLTWDEMIPAERKLLKDASLLPEDEEALLAKYAQ